MSANLKHPRTESRGLVILLGYFDSAQKTGRGTPFLRLLGVIAVKQNLSNRTKIPRVIAACKCPVNTKMRVGIYRINPDTPVPNCPQARV